MRTVQRTFTAQRLALAVACVGSLLIFWRGGFDPFHLPKATLILLALVVGVLAAGVRVALTAQASLDRSPFSLASLAFLGALVVATLVSDVPQVSLPGEYKRWSGAVMYTAYVGLGLIALRVATERWLERFVAVLVGGFAVVAFYGAVQVLDADPWSWVEVYGERVAISTLGNPNFSSAALGISVPLAIWSVLRVRGTARKVALGAVTALILVILNMTASVQGLVAGTAGAGIFLLAWLLEQKGPVRRYGVRAWLAGALLGFVSLVAGLAGVGPAAPIVGAGTLELRKFYWEAAINMFRANPLTGVGLDLYGGYYHTFRSADAARALPIDLTVDAPHSVPLNMFASGGLLLGVSFLAVLFATLWALVVGLRDRSGSTRLLIGALGGAWLAYVTQALVSIDVPALAVLHWVFAGSLVGLSRSEAQAWTATLPWSPSVAASGKRSKASAAHRAAVSRYAVATAVIVGLTASWSALRPLRADTAAGTAQLHFFRENSAQAASALREATELAPWQGRYWFELGRAYTELEQYDDALAAIQEALRVDPLWLHGHITMARAADRTGHPGLAEEHYAAALEIEPQSPQLKTEAAQFFLAEGQPQRAVEVLQEATSFQPSDVGSWALLAEAHRAAGDVAAARAAAERALELAPGNEDLLKFLRELDA